MVLLLAAAAVVAGVIVVAAGRGGEMAIVRADHAPFVLGRVTAADVALLSPPRSLWGYNAQITEEALQAIAEAVTERDVEIERLRAQLAHLAGDGPSAGGNPGVTAAGGREAGGGPVPEDRRDA